MREKNQPEAYNNTKLAKRQNYGQGIPLTVNPKKKPWQKYNTIQQTIRLLPKIFENGMICWTGDAWIGNACRPLSRR